MDLLVLNNKCYSPKKQPPDISKIEPHLHQVAVDKSMSELTSNSY